MPETLSSETGIDTLLIMGEIVGVHGLEGNVKIRSFVESPDLFAPGNQVFISEQSRTDVRTFVIERCVPFKKGLLMRLSGIDNREAAQWLIGRQVLVHRSRLPEPDDNTWYWQDLYGLAVKDEILGDIGIIDTLFTTGAHDILVVKDRTKERLIPMHRKFVLSVDIENALITTRLPEGYE